MYFLVTFKFCMMFSLVDHSLKIRGIQVSDGGDYTCYISTNGPPVSVTHNLQILGKYMSSIHTLQKGLPKFISFLKIYSFFPVCNFYYLPFLFAILHVPFLLANSRYSRIIFPSSPFRDAPLNYPFAAPLIFSPPFCASLLFHSFIFFPLLSLGLSHRSRLKTEEKAKVFASVWSEEFISIPCCASYFV